MDEPTQPVAPAPLGQDTRPNRKLIIGAVVVLVLVVLALGPMLWKNLSAAMALGGARIIVTGTEKDGLYGYGLLGMRPVSVPVKGTVTDYTRSGAHEAVIVHEGDVSRSVVYLLGDEPRLIGDALSEKGSLAVSPDGAWVAYAKRVSQGTDLHAWNVHVVEVATGNAIEVGAGYGAQFFVRDGKTRVLVFTPGGLTVVDPASRTSFTTAFETPSNIYTLGAISADGSYFVSRGVGGGDLMFFSVTSVEPYLMLTLVGTHPGFLMNPSFDGGSVIAMQGSEIKRIDPAAPEASKAVHTFPETTGSYRLIP